MNPATIAILHPGEMGAAIGACLIANGARVVWASAGRGSATRRRAATAGLEDLGTVANAVKAANAAGATGIVFSVCPPQGALALAGEVAANRFHGIFVDANAVAPATARQIGGVVEAAGATFVDGGIIGPPPAEKTSSRLYLSGARAKEIAALFAGTRMEAIAIDAPAGAASALKACYAAWSKGSTALLAAIRVLARHEGVDTALLEEWKRSQPELPRRSENVAIQARKAWRWVAEMEEIAASFEAAHVPGNFHLAAAEIYTRLAQFKDGAAPPSLAEVIAALEGAPRSKHA